MKISNKDILKLTFFSVMCCCSAIANAGFHYYHPSITVELGKAYDSFRPDVDVRSSGFFKWSETGFTQAPGLSDLQFKYSEVESIDQLYESLRIDINAEAKFGVSSGKASISHARELDFSGRSLTIVVTAFREYKEEAKKGNLSLTKLGIDRLKQAQDAGKLYLWRQVAGSEVVSSIVKGASTSIIYQFKSSSLEKKEALKSALSATWATGSANADFMQTAKSIDDDYSVTISYNQVGGSSDTTVLQNLINSKPGNIQALRKAMAGSLKNVSEKNAKLQFFKTTTIDSIGDVVFNTEGKISDVSTHFMNVIQARKEHFRRLLIANSRIEIANKLLDGKPDNSFTSTGKAKLTSLIDKIIKTRNKIISESSKYDSNNPSTSTITLNAGAVIPRIVPTTYFNAPFAKLASWERTNLSFVRCGTKPYDCEFHDFYQSFYGKLEMVHPDFVERIRLIKNCNPVATIRSSQLKSFIANGGNLSNFYNSSHKREGVYTWGANNLPGEKNKSLSIFSGNEGKNKYILEITDIEAYTHYVKIGSYGKSDNSMINDIEKICANVKKI
jgi:hypothetical protein